MNKPKSLQAYKPMNIMNLKQSKVVDKNASLVVSTSLLGFLISDESLPG